jgi:hypothetical protein
MRHGKRKSLPVMEGQRYIVAYGVASGFQVRPPSSER